MIYRACSLERRSSVDCSTVLAYNITINLEGKYNTRREQVKPHLTSSCTASLLMALPAADFVGTAPAGDKMPVVSSVTIRSTSASASASNPSGYIGDRIIRYDYLLAFVVHLPPSSQMRPL